MIRKSLIEQGQTRHMQWDADEITYINLSIPVYHIGYPNSIHLKPEGGIVVDYPRLFTIIPLSCKEWRENNPGLSLASYQLKATLDTTSVIISDDHGKVSVFSCHNNGRLTVLHSLLEQLQKEIVTYKKDLIPDELAY